MDGAGLCGRRQRNLLDGGGGGVAVRFDEGVGQLGAPRPRPVREGGRREARRGNRKQCSVALHCNSEWRRRPNNNPDASKVHPPSSESSTPARVCARPGHGRHARSQVRQSGTVELHLWRRWRLHHAAGPWPGRKEAAEADHCRKSSIQMKSSS